MLNLKHINKVLFIINILCTASSQKKEDVIVFGCTLYINQVRGHYYNKGAVRTPTHDIVCYESQHGMQRWKTQFFATKRNATSRSIAESLQGRFLKV